LGAKNNIRYDGKRVPIFGSIEESPHKRVSIRRGSAKNTRHEGLEIIQDCEEQEMEEEVPPIFSIPDKVCFN
jgi:hypothetical protein